MVRLDARGVVVRDFLLADLAEYARWMTGAQEWRRLDGPYYPGPDEKEVASRLDALEERIAKANWPEPRQRLVIAEASSDRLIGTVSRYWISRETRWMAAGIDIYDPECWGRGLGRQSLGLWCDYLFRTYRPPLARLDLRTWSGNERMMRLAESLGFRREACFRKARIVDGRYFDSLGYGVLREEWEERFAGGFR